MNYFHTKLIFLLDKIKNKIQKTKANRVWLKILNKCKKEKK